MGLIYFSPYKFTKLGKGPFCVSPNSQLWLKFSFTSQSQPLKTGIEHSSILLNKCKSKLSLVRPTLLSLEHDYSKLQGRLLRSNKHGHQRYYKHDHKQIHYMIVNLILQKATNILFDHLNSNSCRLWINFTDILFSPPVKFFSHSSKNCAINSISRQQTSSVEVCYRWCQLITRRCTTLTKSSPNRDCQNQNCYTATLTNSVPRVHERGCRSAKSTGFNSQ